MFDAWFGSVFSSNTTVFSPVEYLICAVTAALLGAVIAAVFMVKSRSSLSFAATLVLLPVAVQAVILLVNGNLGAGVAVAGAFSLVRFRSVPGTAREITAVFSAMAVGLAAGMGYLGLAVLFTLLVSALQLIMAFVLPHDAKDEKQLRITIPETLDYENVFDDVFEQYTVSHRLLQVKTTDLGSLYKLTFGVVLKKGVSEKAFIDDLRCRNGNLEISCGRPANPLPETL